MRVTIVTAKGRLMELVRRAVLEIVRTRAAATATTGPSTARSQDFLYDEGGLPT